MSITIPPGLEKTYIGLLYETGIIFLFLILLILIIIHYSKKKTVNTLLLLGSFTGIFVAIIFSWLSKFYLIKNGILGFDDLDPNIPNFWFISVLLQFRISFVLLVIAADFTYILKVKVFDDMPKKIERLILIILSIATILFALIAIEQGNVLLDVLSFLSVLVIMTYVYVPFIIASLKMYRILEETQYKRATLSLSAMSFSFIMVFVSFLADRLIMLIFNSEGYTFFYFSAWAFSIIAAFAAYLGYIRTSRKKSLKEEKNTEQEKQI